MLRGTAREAAAEFWGTFILMIFGLGVNAQVTLGSGNFGDFYSVNVGWGLAVTMGVYACSGISGAHINPAVTLAVAVLRKFPKEKILPYIAAQFAGAFAAAVMIYLVYYEALDAFDGGVRQVTGDQATAGIFGTYPRDFLSTFPGGLVDQIVGTALLVAMVFALTDERNQAPKSNLGPLLVGGIVLLIGMTFGSNTGYAINPARDFSPRLFTYLAGWGSEVFTAHNYFWWAPVVGPCIGGILGGFLYDLFIAKHHPPGN